MSVRVGQRHGHAIESLIDYNGPQLCNNPSPFPEFEMEDFLDLFNREMTITDDELLDELIFKGGFWVWMRPDRYTQTQIRFYF